MLMCRQLKTGEKALLLILTRPQIHQIWGEYWGPFQEEKLRIWWTHLRPRRKKKIPTFHLTTQWRKNDAYMCNFLSNNLDIGIVCHCLGHATTNHLVPIKLFSIIRQFLCSRDVFWLQKVVKASHLRQFYILAEKKKIKGKTWSFCISCTANYQLMRWGDLCMRWDRKL